MPIFLVSDFILAVRALARNTWGIFQRVTVPGLGVSFAVMLVSLYAFKKIVSLVRYLGGNYSNDDNNNKIYKKGE